MYGYLITETKRYIKFSMISRCLLLQFSSILNCSKQWKKIDRTLYKTLNINFFKRLSRVDITGATYVHTSALRCVRVRVYVYLFLFSLSLLSLYSLSLSFSLSLLSVLSMCVTGYPCVWQHSRTNPRTKSTALHCIAQASVLARARLTALYIIFRVRVLLYIKIHKAAIPHVLSGRYRAAVRVHRVHGPLRAPR